jgi:hypothetical protein
MARIDYYGIEKAIADTIASDTRVAEFAITVVVEEEVMFERGNKVYVFLERRAAPEDRQSISAGTRTRMLCKYVIWCMAYGYKINETIEVRDNLLGAVELALMTDRTFGRSDVATSWIEGGEFDNAKDEAGFNVMGSIELTVDVTAINS